MSLHPLDHLVLPVADLGVAQTRFMALGFTVAPVGVHPFGTANCCVFLADGTFLEPLAVADRTQVEKAVEASNVFVARDQVFRRVRGEEGFSALVLGTNDAEADDRNFRDLEISAGPPLEFSRAVLDKTGKTGTATFRLAFAADNASPEPFFFTCQRVKAPKINRAALQQHRNGVGGLRRVLLVADEPAEHSEFLTGFSGAVPRAAKDGTLKFNLGASEIVVLTPQALASQHGVHPESSGRSPGLSLNAVVFSATSLEKLASLFNADGITYLARDGSLVVPPSAGQGAVFIFEANE